LGLSSVKNYIFLKKYLVVWKMDVMFAAGRFYKNREVGVNINIIIKSLNSN
jgi:hypothetical protein